MKCLYCQQHTPDNWQVIGYIPGAGRDFTTMNVKWMRCANPECEQAMVMALEEHVGVDPDNPARTTARSVEWVVRPRTGSRPIDPLVPEPVRNDYLESAQLLDLSPRMSAVLSRRVLADLLQTYAKLTQYNLKDRIDAFIGDESHPGYVRENLHHLREAGNFGAHTMKDDQDQVLDVSREEAEWTLDTLDVLFDYFIIAPERSRVMREKMNEKIDAARRKPTAPSPT